LSELNIYILILVACVIYLNTGFAFKAKGTSIAGHDNLLIIEQLTAKSSKPKNYRTAPGSYASYGYNVEGSILGEKATFKYTFPFTNKGNVTFQTEISTSEMSGLVSGFGVHSSCFAPVSDGYYALQTTDSTYLHEHMNRDGFFYRSNQTYDYGVDYNEIIRLSVNLSKEIATFIVQELGSNDSYDNRVMVALNFVQFLPYGQPNFNAGEYSYFGVSMPHESFVISYSDCDSKSVLFCGILQELIENASENIIMVYCTMQEEHHMIVGVHGLNFPGRTHIHNGKPYLLLETTSPISLEKQQLINFENIHVFNLRFHG